MEISKVKKDLRELRKIAHSIDAGLEAKKLHERRLAYLMTLAPCKAVNIEIDRTENNLRKLKIEDYIERANKIEEVYFKAITKLENFDRVIVIKCFVNGEPYWKVGRDIGFTEAGIRKRIEKIYPKIAELIKKDLD